MGILGFILEIVGEISYMLLSAYQFIVIAAVIISWLRPSNNQPFVYQLIRFILQATEPAFRFIRKKMPKALLSTGIDFSPLILLLGVYIFQKIAIKIMFYGKYLQASTVMQQTIEQGSRMNGM